MKRYVHASNASEKGLESAYKMYTDRAEYRAMIQQDAYKYLDSLLNDEMDAWVESHPGISMWVNEVPKEDVYRPSRQLRKIAREMGYEVDHSLSKYIWWKHSWDFRPIKK